MFNYMRKRAQKVAGQAEEAIAEAQRKIEEAAHEAQQEAERRIAEAQAATGLAHHPPKSRARLVGASKRATHRRSETASPDFFSKAAGDEFAAARNGGLLPGARLWVEDHDTPQFGFGEAWTPGVVRQTNVDPKRRPDGKIASFVVVELEDGPIDPASGLRGAGRGRELRFDSAKAASFAPVVESTLTAALSDLVELEAYSEGAILHQTRWRFARDQIYTYVGKILVAVNPYRPLDVYGTLRMARAQQGCGGRHGGGGGGGAGAGGGVKPEPHVYSIGAAAYASLVSDGKSQSVLISGESGAGKTETTKYILQFLVYAAGQGAVALSATSAEGRGVDSGIVGSNPILEAFGNAKTRRNDNSSRFGKWMQIAFSRAGALQGCRITNYLLEASRVASPGAGERSYHVFYALLAGAAREHRARWDLPPKRDALGEVQPVDPCEHFGSLRGTGCVSVKGVDEGARFDEVVGAMAALGFGVEQQLQIFQVVSALLHLLNVGFLKGVRRRESIAMIGPGTDRADGCDVTNFAAMGSASQLLGVSEMQLAHGLTMVRRRIERRGSSVAIDMTYSPLPVRTAEHNRAAMAKVIYSKLFDWLVTRINDKLSSKEPPALHIGVLDIFGFEVFDTNYFEQLCINYANEKLQQHFNACIFKMELDMYREEEVPCDEITFVDNQACLDMLDRRPLSIFAMLDEEVKVTGGSDATFTSKLHRTFAETKPAHDHYIRNPKVPMSFGVRHFAGDVSYTTEGILDKNRDKLPADLQQLLQESTMPLVASLFPPPEELAPEPVVPGAPRYNTPSGARRGAAPKKTTTIVSQFQQQLRALMASLQPTLPHFVRCIKPNGSQAPMKWEGVLCLRQLKYAGLFEAIKIRKAGFAFRIPHADFWRRYVVLAPRLEAMARAGELGEDAVAEDAAGCCRLLLAALPSDAPESDSETAAAAAAAAAGLKTVAEGEEGGMTSDADADGGASAAVAAAPVAVVTAGTSLFDSGRAARWKSADLLLPRSEWCVGKTKVFIRSDRGRLALERMTEVALYEHVLTLQRFARRFLTWFRANKQIIELRRQRAEVQRRREEAAAAERRVHQEAVQRRLERYQMVTSSATAIQRRQRGINGRGRALREKLVRQLQRMGEMADLDDDASGALADAMTEVMRTVAAFWRGGLPSSDPLSHALRGASLLAERMQAKRALRQRLGAAVRSRDFGALQLAIATLREAQSGGGFPEWGAMGEAVAAEAMWGEMVGKRQAYVRLRRVVFSAMCNRHATLSRLRREAAASHGGGGGSGHGGYGNLSAADIELGSLLAHDGDPLGQALAAAQRAGIEDIPWRSAYAAAAAAAARGATAQTPRGARAVAAARRDGGKLAVAAATAAAAAPAAPEPSKWPAPSLLLHCAAGVYLCIQPLLQARSALRTAVERAERAVLRQAQQDLLTCIHGYFEEREQAQLAAQEAERSMRERRAGIDGHVHMAAVTKLSVGQRNDCCRREVRASQMMLKMMAFEQELRPDFVTSERGPRRSVAAAPSTVALPGGALQLCRQITRPRGEGAEQRERAAADARLELKQLFEQQQADAAAQGAMVPAAKAQLPLELVEMALCHHKWAETFATWQGAAAEKERRARRAADAKEVVVWWDGSGDAVRASGRQEGGGGGGSPASSPRRGGGGVPAALGVAALPPAPPSYMRTTTARRGQTGRRQSAYSPTKRAPRVEKAPRVDAGWSRRLEAAEMGARPVSSAAQKAESDLNFRLRESRMGHRAARSAYKATSREHALIFPQQTGNWRK